MDIASYLDNKRRHLGQTSGKVKDFAVFDYNYIPEKPVERAEVREIVKQMLRFEMSGIPAHMAVVGSRGSGKTLMLKYLQRVVCRKTQLDVLYVNCRHHNTSFKIFAYLLDQEKIGGSSLGDLYHRFMAKFQKRTVLIMDEVNLMSPKDKNREILYFLSRSEQPYMVIMLSNTPNVVKQLDAATSSSLQPLRLYFRNYDAQQLGEILLGRASKGLHSWDDSHIAQIAALTAQRTNSDARVAIIVIDQVNDLTDANLIILWAAATSKSDLAKDIYDRYCRYSRDHQIKPFSYMYFYTNLGYLQSVGLVALVAAKIDRTYTNRIVLTFDKSIAEQSCKLRFE